MNYNVAPRRKIKLFWSGLKTINKLWYQELYSNSLMTKIKVFYETTFVYVWRLLSWNSMHHLIFFLCFASYQSYQHSKMKTHIFNSRFINKIDLFKTNHCDSNCQVLSNVPFFSYYLRCWFASLNRFINFPVPRKIRKSLIENGLWCTEVHQ